MVNFPGNSRSPGPWILGLFILVLTLLSSANLYLLLQTREGTLPMMQEEEPVMQAPIFVKVGPMTVNLIDNVYGNRLLYTGLSLRVMNEETRELLITHMPELHSRLLLLLAAQSAEQLSTPEGKELLAKQVLAIFDEPLLEGLPLAHVNAVLFTDFIVQ